MQFTEQDIRDIYPSYTESGSFFASVTAGGVYPLPQTRLSLYVYLPDGTAKPYRVMMTNDSGETEPISLPAPPRSLSESPDTNGQLPYAIYRLIAEKEGYYPALIERLPIFSGITSRQALRLLPLSESDRVGPERLIDASPDADINAPNEIYDTGIPEEPPETVTVPDETLVQDEQIPSQEDAPLPYAQSEESPFIPPQQPEQPQPQSQPLNPMQPHESEVPPAPLPSQTVSPTPPPTA